MNHLLESMSRDFAVTILGCISDGVVVIDQNETILFCDKVAETMVGISEEEVYKRTFSEVFMFYNSITMESIKNPLVEVLSKSMCYILEDNVMFITKQNVRKDIVATFSPTYDNDGSLSGAVIILKDVTRIRILEKEQLVEKNNMQILFEMAPEAMLTLDENGIITKVNSAATRLLENDENNHYTGKCNQCGLDKTLKNMFHQQKDLQNQEIKVTMNQAEGEKTSWFRLSTAPIIVNGKKNTVVTLIDITENVVRENKMIEARDFSRNILNQLPTLVWMTDATLRCTYINQIFSQYTGIQLSEMKESTFIDLIFPDDLEEYVAVRKSAMRDRQSIRSEVRIRRKDGIYRWCLAVDSPYFDLQNQFSGYIGSFYDIEEQKKAEEHLKRYRKIINHAKDLVLLTDTQGWIIEANKSAVIAYGYSEEELCQINIKNIWKNWSCPDYEDDLEGKSGHSIETKHKKKNGETFQVEMNTQILKVGKKHIVFNISRDITERKRAESDVRSHREKYYYLFMNMKNSYASYKLIYGKDHKPCDMMLVEMNHACEEFFGKQKEELIGKTFKELFPNSVELFMQTVRKHSGKLILGENIDLEDYYLSDYEKWLSISIYSPYPDEIIAISNDITEKKEFELKLISTKEAAELASRAKSEFLANMSHEIRTPINGVMGMVDLTLLTELNEEQRDNLTSAKACANSLLKIINDILDFSKMEAGKLSIETISFDLKQLVEEVMKSYAPRVKEKNLELMYAMDSQIPQFLIGDPNRIRQVINNLLSNAMKFTKEGSILLTIKCEKKEEAFTKLKFSVKDTGIGIGKEEIGKLFQSFQQVEQTYTKKYGGTGLGLAISKNLIELMGGKIGVESKIGKGSNFYFTLKLGLGQDSQNREQVGLVNRATKKYRILVAEDDKLNQTVVIKMLQEREHNVMLARNGVEAIALWEENQFDVVLMDIQMPELDGIVATKIIREKETDGNRTPIIALTAYTLKGDREKFLMAGMDGYLPKPFSMEELYETIEKVISKVKEEYTKPNFYEEISKMRDLLLADVSEEGLKNRTPMMIKEIKENINLMEEAIKNDRLLVLEEAAHALKMQAIEIEDVMIKDIAFAVELAVRRGNWNEAVQNVSKIKVAFEKMKKKNEEGKA